MYKRQPYNAPTQNAVDMYERKGADGNYYPITDPRSGYDAVKTTNPAYFCIFVPHPFFIFPFHGMGGIWIS